MTITTFDKLSPQDQSLVRLAMQYRDNAYTPYSHHQVGGQRPYSFRHLLRWV